MDNVTNCPECSQKFNVTADASHEIENVLHMLRNSIAASSNPEPSEALLQFVKHQSDSLEFEMCIDCCRTLQKAVDTDMSIADAELQQYEAVLTNNIDPDIMAETARMKEMIRVHGQQIIELDYELKHLASVESALQDEVDKLCTTYATVENDNIALKREYNRCKRELTGAYVSKARSTSLKNYHNRPPGVITSSSRESL